MSEKTTRLKDKVTIAQ